jgi:type I restriction enzyme S subunit
MMSDKRVLPLLRFSSFLENWKEQKLGDAFINSRKKGDNSLPIYSVSQSKGLVPRESLDRVIQKDAKANQNLRVEPEDLSYNMMRMWQGAIGIADTTCMVSPAYVVLKPKKNSSSKFFLYQFEKSRTKYLFTSYSRGLTLDRLRLYFDDFASIKSSSPSLPEQQKIATFLTAVDRRIELLKEKKEKLEAYKKGVMQQLFSRKIRFKQDDGSDFPEWVEKKLGEVLSIGSGRDYKHLNAGNIPIYGTGGIMSYVDDFLFDGESVGIGRKGTIDKPVFLSGKFWTVDTLFYTHSFNAVTPSFVYRLFLTINWKKHNEASGVPSLSKATIEKLKVEVPTISEQEKISNFLDSVDLIISGLQAQINQTQTWKKGLLQQMFV